MAQESKKISFGFSKSIKKPDLKPIAQIERKKIDYIEYVDDKSIKVIGKEEKKDEPLVIPMLGSKSWHDRIINKINADIYGVRSGDIKKNGNIKVVDENKKISNGGDTKNTSAEVEVKAAEKGQQKNQRAANNPTKSLEELAAQEIIQDLQEDNERVESIVDISIEQSTDLTGEKEPTLENYEEIPIEQFGVALLRGMGWKPEEGIGKNSKIVSVTVPNLRPRGMGLGADKIMLQKKTVELKTKEEKELKLENGCYVRIVAGKYNDNYGQLESFEDESGRLIIKLAIGNKCVSLNEYLVEPVTKENYMKNSKVLNISTYEKFNNKSDIKSKLNEPSDRLEDKCKKVNEITQNKRSNHKKTSKYRDKSCTSDESNSSDDKHKRKYELNGSDSNHKSKKLKKYRRRDNSEGRKSSKKDRNREKSHHSSSSKSSDKKKHKKRKRSRSTSLDNRR